ncbi:unnamed protein product [Amoebophrya sp. A120]|nr:unnamed protein product [Amoebophrya sp. A120]|eukprot:GSA120T00007269001.1
MLWSKTITAALMAAAANFSTTASGVIVVPPVPHTTEHSQEGTSTAQRKVALEAASPATSFMGEAESVSDDSHPCVNDFEPRNLDHKCWGEILGRNVTVKFTCQTASGSTCVGDFSFTHCVKPDGEKLTYDCDGKCYKGEKNPLDPKAIECGMTTTTTTTTTNRNRSVGGLIVSVAAGTALAALKIWHDREIAAATAGAEKRKRDAAPRTIKSFLQEQAQAEQKGINFLHDEHAAASTPTPLGAEEVSSAGNAPATAL